MRQLGVTVILARDDGGLHSNVESQLEKGKPVKEML